MRRWCQRWTEAKLRFPAGACLWTSARPHSNSSCSVRKKWSRHQPISTAETSSCPLACAAHIHAASRTHASRETQSGRASVNVNHNHMGLGQAWIFPQNSQDKNLHTLISTWPLDRNYFSKRKKARPRLPPHTRSITSFDGFHQQISSADSKFKWNTYEQWLIVWSAKGPALLCSPASWEGRGGCKDSATTLNPGNQPAVHRTYCVFASQTPFRGPCVVGTSKAGGGWGVGGPSVILLERCFPTWAPDHFSSVRKETSIRQKIKPISGNKKHTWSHASVILDPWPGKQQSTQLPYNAKFLQI